MAGYVKKSDIVRGHVKSGRWKEALRIEKGFRRGVTEEERRRMALAYECIVHPEFYRQLGYDLNAKIAKGVEVVVTLYA